MEAREAKEAREARETKKVMEAREAREAMETKKTRKATGTKKTRKAKKTRITRMARETVYPWTEDSKERKSLAKSQISLIQRNNGMKRKASFRNKQVGDLTKKIRMPNRTKLKTGKS